MENNRKPILPIKVRVNENLILRFSEYDAFNSQDEIPIIDEDKQLTASNKIKQTYKEKGLTQVLLTITSSLKRRLTVFFSLNYYRIWKSQKKFTFNQIEYKYFYHKYNATWKCERAVEIPIIWNIVQGSQGQILEIGNVLSHYKSFPHDTIDKYEKAEGVINQDVVDIDLPKKYDLIIAISTLEHVGWDEDPKKHDEHIEKPEKIIKAIANLRALLNNKGKIIITIPLGHNLYLDEALDAKTLGFDQIFCLKRISKDNRWIQTEWKNIKGSKYNSPFPSANAIVIGVIRKSSTVGDDTQ